MSKNLNSKCHLCGAMYQRCDNCDKLKHAFTSWKMLADTEDHYKIFCILRNYGLKKISKEEAAKQLSSYDLSDVDKWTHENNKKLVKEVMEVARPIKTKKKTYKPEVVEEIVIEEEKEVVETTEE